LREIDFVDFSVALWIVAAGFLLCFARGWLGSVLGV
jgi:hypothetical protein